VAVLHVRERNGEKILEVYSDSVAIDRGLKDDFVCAARKLKVLPPSQVSESPRAADTPSLRTVDEAVLVGAVNHGAMLAETLDHIAVGWP